MRNIMLTKFVLKFRRLFCKNFECSEINVIGLTPKKWTILHPKSYAEYKYSDHTQNIFICFEHTV